MDNNGMQQGVYVIQDGKTTPMFVKVADAAVQKNTHMEKILWDAYKNHEIPLEALALFLNKESN